MTRSRAPRSAPGGGAAERRMRAQAARALAAAGEPFAKPSATLINPDWVTAAGAAAAVVAGFAAAAGLPRAARRSWSLSLAADVFDGALARGRTMAGLGSNPAGAVNDSTADRAAEAAAAVGATIGALRAGRTVTAALCAAAGATAPIPSHVSAKAAAVGFTAPRHAPGRAERGAAWAVVLGSPRFAGPAAAAIIAGNVSSSWRRLASVQPHR